MLLPKLLFGPYFKYYTAHHGNSKKKKKKKKKSLVESKLWEQATMAVSLLSPNNATWTVTVVMHSSFQPR